MRTATVVLGEFRAAAVGDGDVADLARQIDHRIVPYLTDEEDFVTGVFVDIHDDGRFDVVCCGHPGPMVVGPAGEVEVLEVDHARPLGLGADPVVRHGRLTAGDRLLLYTDGLVEARSDDRVFVDPVRTCGAQPQLRSPTPSTSSWPRSPGPRARPRRRPRAAAGLLRPRPGSDRLTARAAPDPATLSPPSRHHRREKSVPSMRRTPRT